MPYSLAIGMGATLIGLVLLSMANDYAHVLLAAALVGTGSAVFHPEASRVARMASGGRYGVAQSLFQVGGNLGGAIGPLLAAFIVLPRGQGAIAWFSLVALLAMVVLARVGMWYAAHLRPAARGQALQRPPPRGIPRDARALLRLPADAAGVLEKRLYLQPDLVLHVLPDRALPPVGAGRRRCSCSSSWPRSRSARWWAARCRIASAGAR